MDLDKKSNGQLKNDCIVSTSISYGGEHEYLLIMVHEFSINGNLPIKEPIILMVDLRNINFNVNYNNSDTNNNNRNLLNIKFFHGFQQNRFKLQCGFGGFQLPPLSKKSQIYQESKYQYNKQLKNNKKYKESLSKQKKQSKVKNKLMNTSLTYSNGHSHHSYNRSSTQRQRHRQIQPQIPSSTYPHHRYCDHNDNIYIDPDSLNNNELRNIRIPFAQSLQNPELSQLQNHINQNVDYHYQGLTSFNKNNKTKKKNESLHNKSMFNHQRTINENNSIGPENDDEDDNKESLSPSKMINECIKIALKHPEFLPSKLLDDTQCNINESINDIQKFEPKIRSLFTTLPISILNKLYKFMQNKMNIIEKKQESQQKQQQQHIRMKRGGKVGRNNNLNDIGTEWINIDESKSKLKIKHRLLKKEISNAFKYCGKGKLMNNNNNNGQHTNIEYEQLDSSSSTAISSGSLNSLSHSLNNKYLLSPTSDNYNSIENMQNRSLSSISSSLSIVANHFYFDDTKYNPQNLKKKCLQLKEKRDKLTHSKHKNNKNNLNRNNIIGNDDNNGRSHYLFQKYIRSQIVNDDSDLKYFSNNIDKLLTKYANDNDIDIIKDNEEWNHLAMEMKYFLWHKHLKQQHFNKMKQEHYHKISKKKKRKKLKKLQAMDVESKLKYALKKKKENGEEK